MNGEATNREKLLTELAEMSDEDLFETIDADTALNCILCPDCRTAGHACPGVCDYVGEWMRAPCRHERLLEEER